MIEKNSELMSLFSVNSEQDFDESDLLDCIYKEKKDKKNGHGEDINVRIFSIFSDLYSKHTASGEKYSLCMTKRNRTGRQSTALYEIQQRRHDLFLPASKINENDVSLRDSNSLLNSRLTLIETAAVNNSGKLTHIGDDDSREKNTETIKIHTFGQLKNDVMQPRQELLRQDMPPRRLPASVAEHMLPSHIGAIIESTATQKKSLNIKYPFLRWAGEHSVKVTIPIDISSSRHLSLLPSDFRAAEVLSRQASHLNGFTTELLHPYHNDEESDRRHSQNSKEEEQE